MAIESQLNSADHQVLQDMHGLVSGAGTYNYLEIGSYLGGSLQYALTSKNCVSATSVDTRLTGAINDERKIPYKYTVTTNDMLAHLHENNLDTAKLQCIDGSIADVDQQGFSLAFIDGEHTVMATFSDALQCLDRISEDSILLFHDSWIVFSAIDCINLLLEKQQRKFVGYKFTDSAIYAIAFGKFIPALDSHAQGRSDNWKEYKHHAQLQLSREILKNSRNT